MTEVIELPIERFEAFEEKLGIKLEGLCAILDSDEDDGVYTVVVNGDVFAIDGTTIEQDIKLVVSCHDSLGRVIGSDYDFIESESFLGIYTFTACLSPHISVSKVRIYPQI